MTEKKVLFIIIGFTLVTLIIWLFWESKPKPGELIADLGRGHVPIGTEVKYNSNPPTSGPHYEEWTKPAVYDKPLDDRNLLHSLEHGYVIISYNCSFKKSAYLIKEAIAHESTDAINEASAGAVASFSAQLSEDFNSQSCKDLVNKLKKIYDNIGPHKLIVVVRPNLDAVIALTAWRYIDKLNSFDQGRIEKFIDAHRDQGPEKTIEQP